MDIMHKKAFRDFVIAVLLLIATLTVMFLLLATKCTPEAFELRRIEHTSHQNRAFTNPPQSTEEVIEVESDDFDSGIPLQVAPDGTLHLDLGTGVGINPTTGETSIDPFSF